jgi:hypothetical protein
MRIVNRRDEFQDSLALGGKGFNRAIADTQRDVRSIGTADRRKPLLREEAYARRVSSACGVTPKA